MYKDILRSIAGVDVFPIISLCLFVGVFAIALVRTMRVDRARMARYASLPLDAEGPMPGSSTESRKSFSQTGAAQ
jgi:hypothetical protein